MPAKVASVEDTSLPDPNLTDHHTTNPEVYCGKQFAGREPKSKYAKDKQFEGTEPKPKYAKDMSQPDPIHTANHTPNPEMHCDKQFEGKELESKYAKDKLLPDSHHTAIPEFESEFVDMNSIFSSPSNTVTDKKTAVHCDKHFEGKEPNAKYAADKSLPDPMNKRQMKHVRWMDDPVELANDRLRQGVTDVKAEVSTSQFVKEATMAVHVPLLSLNDLKPLAACSRGCWTWGGAMVDTHFGMEDAELEKAPR